jgi:arylsulfotransferase ASST
MNRGLELLALFTTAAFTFENAAHGQAPSPTALRASASRQPGSTRGVTRHEPGAAPGYTLIAPLRSTTIHLVDLDGREVHRWCTSHHSGTAVLLENGDLLRCCVEPNQTRFSAGGACGRLEELDWDGNVVWSYAFADETHRQHHDVKPLPNGHVVFIAWEAKTREEAREAGRHPRGIAADGFWSECILEVAPTPPHGASVVWEWHALDHVIQDLDRDSDNYGDVAAHPERIDLNADLALAAPTPEEIARLRALGYAGPVDTPAAPRPDWLHLNALDYDPAHDQIVVSSRHLDEVWIIDRSTTTAQAHGHVGGRSGRGGDLLWRWGNPRNYRAGDGAVHRLFGQHDARFVPSGFPGAGHLTVFNNGWRRPGGALSEVLELELPRNDGVDGSTGFALDAGGAFGPDAPCRRTGGPEGQRFFAPIESGAQRLKNGNTLICDGPRGRVIEIDPAGTLVWDYLDPFGDASEEAAAMPHPLFRATRIAPDHPGLFGRDLSPLQQ